MKLARTAASTTVATTPASPAQVTAMAPPTHATLNTGAEMPLLGYGTWQAKPGELEEPLDAALAAGYRHIDTAGAYGNEDVIGGVLHDKWLGPGKLRREDLFIVTKLPPVGVRPSGPEKWLQRSLEKLRLDYVDMYLVHTPFAVKEQGDEVRPTGPDGKFVIDDGTDHIAIWKAMEAQVDAGRAKAIGLSNFNQRQIQAILDVCRIKPANLQVELHVYMQQKPLVDFCHKHGIVVTAYSPVGSPGSSAFIDRFGLTIKLPALLTNPVIVDVAKRHNKQPGQVLLKHIVQRGVVAIPKSLSTERIAQNIALFDWQLSTVDMARIDALDQGKDGRIFDFTFVGITKSDPVYPFNEYP